MQQSQTSTLASGDWGRCKPLTHKFEHNNYIINLIAHAQIVVELAPLSTLCCCPRATLWGSMGTVRPLYIHQHPSCMVASRGYSIPRQRWQNVFRSESVQPAHPTT